MRCQLILLLTFMLCAADSQAQEEKSTSPEIRQMHMHATEDMQRGNIAGAIVTCKQAIKLAPNEAVLYSDLGKALYLDHQYNEAIKVLTEATNNFPLLLNNYQLLAAAQEQLGYTKKAKSTLQAGLAKKQSGLLFQELGNEYNQEQKKPQALDAWLQGIKKEPDYPDNYYTAAVAYLNSEHVLWGLLYGEQFLYLDRHDTAKESEIKILLFGGYKKLFDEIAVMPEIKKEKGSIATFEQAVLDVYNRLTPVISDGITTENLTMVRTRFLMEWYRDYAKKYPFSLFAYQDESIRSGHFDMANEWLFGIAESKTQYDAWNTFHEGDMRRYDEWRMNHKLFPFSSEFYNNQ